MENLKKYSKKTFWTVTVYVFILAAGASVGIFQGIQWLQREFSENIAKEIVMENLSSHMKTLELIFANFYSWVVPAVFAAFLLIGLVLWIILKNSSAAFFKDQDDSRDDRTRKKSKKDFVDQKIEQERKRRLFLHTLSVLQRDGRLLDFFNEDLKLYEDEQIGAAVRSIQEDCKKTIKKYIHLKPVVEGKEGETVDVEAGFDIDSIKLTGNVAGEPPFKGRIKHRGWKAGKREIPRLSDVNDSTIITPAEIEIQ